MRKQFIIIISFLLLSGSLSFAGTKAVQVDSLWNGLTDTNGNPLNGGKVYTYEAGTTTEKTTWTDADKTTAAANPIILNSVGKALIFADGRYKFVIKDSSNNTLYTYDNLTYFTQYYGDFVYARDYGDGSLTRATISSAISAIGSDKRTLCLAPGDWVIDGGDLTIPPNINLKFEGGARLSIATGRTVTINGTIEAPLLQIFTWSGTGKVVFGSGSIPEAYPEWWGAVADNSTDCAAAINAAVAAFPNGGKVKFPSIGNSYKVTTSIEVPSGVTLEGSNYSVYEDRLNTINYTGTAQAILSKEGFHDTGASVDIRLRNMSVKATGNGATAIWLQAARSCSVENVNITLTSTSQTGIRLKGEKAATYGGVFYSFFKQIKISGKAPISVNSGGTGYTEGDVLTISGGNSNATVKVISISGGVVTDIQLLTGGTAYSTGTGVSTTGGAGTGCTVNINFVVGGVVTTQQSGFYLSGVINNGQVNANTFVEIDVETATNGIVIGPSYNNRFFGATFENITNKAIDFQANADTNTFHNVYFEKVGTCITFFDDPSGNTDAIDNTVFVPFFGANTTTDIYPGDQPDFHTGVNNRVIENVTTWVDSETRALKQGRLPTDSHPRVRYNADGSIVAGDGAQDLTSSSNVVSLKPRIATSGKMYYQLQTGTTGESEDILKAKVGTFQTQADATAHNLITRVIPEGEVWLVHVYVVANQTDETNRAFYAKRAMFYRRTGQNASQQGSTSNIFSDLETDPSWGGVTVDLNVNTIRARVTGKSGAYINWRGYMEVISSKE